MDNSIRGKVLELLAEQQGVDLGGITDNADLYEAGLTSFASVQLMLAIEDNFGVEFSENMLNRKTFASLSNIVGGIATLLAQKAA